MNHRIDTDGILIATPTREDIENIKVGDLVPNCFGKWSVVTSITARSTDIHGKLFVCLYTKFGERSTMSGSFKEGETVSTVPLTNKYKQSCLVAA